MTRAQSLHARATALRALARAIDAEADALDADADTRDDAVEQLICAADAGLTAAEWSTAIHKKGLRGVRIGRRLLARKSDFQAWLASCSTERVPESGARLAVGDDDELDHALARARGARR